MRKTLKARLLEALALYNTTTWNAVWESNSALGHVRGTIMMDGAFMTLQFPAQMGKTYTLVQGVRRKQEELLARERAKRISSYGERHDQWAWTVLAEALTECIKYTREEYPSEQDDSGKVSGVGVFTLETPHGAGTRAGAGCAPGLVCCCGLSPPGARYPGDGGPVERPAALN